MKCLAGLCVMLITALLLLPAIINPVLSIARFVAGYESYLGIPSRATTAITTSFTLAACCSILANVIVAIVLFYWHKSTNILRTWYLFILLSLLITPVHAQASQALVSVSFIHISKGPFLAIVTMTTYSLPYAFIVQYIRYSSVPKVVWHAANDVGMSPGQRMRFVFLPTQYRGHISGAVFVFLVVFFDAYRVEHLFVHEVYSTLVVGNINSVDDGYIYLVSAVVFLAGAACVALLNLDIFRVGSSRRA